MGARCLTAAAGAALAGPKGMHPAVMGKLHDAFKPALEDPKLKEIMDKHDVIERYMISPDYAKDVPGMVAGEKAALDKLGQLKKD